MLLSNSSCLTFSASHKKLVGRERSSPRNAQLQIAAATIQDSTHANVESADLCP